MPYKLHKGNHNINDKNKNNNNTNLVCYHKTGFDVNFNIKGIKKIDNLLLLAVKKNAFGPPHTMSQRFCFFVFFFL